MVQEFKVSDRDIVTTRSFSVSAQKLWQAWTNPDMLVKWWGPDGFTTTIHQFDFSVGGRWIFTMHGPDGKDYPNEAIFDEISENQLIRYRHLAKPAFSVDVHFSELDSATTLTFIMHFDTKEDRDSVAIYAGPANEQWMTRLGIVLAAR